MVALSTVLWYISQTLTVNLSLLVPGVVSVVFYSLAGQLSGNTRNQINALTVKRSKMPSMRENCSTNHSTITLSMKVNFKLYRTKPRTKKEGLVTTRGSISLGNQVAVSLVGQVGGSKSIRLVTRKRLSLHSAIQILQRILPTEMWNTFRSILQIQNSKKLLSALHSQMDSLMAKSASSTILIRWKVTSARQLIDSLAKLL